MVNILLVEDNPVNSKVLIAMLERAHYYIDWAENGLVGVEMVQNKPSHHYACILMDLQMPVMTGFEAARVIRRLPDTRAEIPIIAVTANMTPDIDQDVKKAGMSQLLGKPVKYDSLIQAIRQEIITEFTL